MATKGGSVLGALALIIAIGALGFELYNLYLISPSEVENEIGGTWYNSEPDLFKASPEDTYVTFSDLTIQFNINTGELVYISYNGWIFLTVSMPYDGLTSLKVYFSLDGVQLESPHIEAQDYHDGINDIHVPASLQYFNSTLSPGLHNVTIVLYGSAIESILTEYNGVRESTLFVQTYLA